MATTDLLRKQTLQFRLRLPPQRSVHTEERRGGQSFNDVFTEKCTGEYADQIQDALAVIDVDETRLDSASALAVKNYRLEPDDLASSYFNQLATAVADFCGPRSALSTVMNEVFEETYQDVFGEPPVGNFIRCLPKRE